MHWWDKTAAGANKTIRKSTIKIGKSFNLHVSRVIFRLENINGYLEHLSKHLDIPKSEFMAHKSRIHASYFISNGFMVPNIIVNILLPMQEFYGAK